MRPAAISLLCLSSLLFAGCTTLDRFNPNRGDYHDESDLVGREGRGHEEADKEPDGMGKWLLSPKARSINRNLGIED